MKKAITKSIIVAILLMMLSSLFILNTFAQHDFLGHYCPAGDTSTYYAYDSSECNRDVNIDFVDSSGSLIKRIVIKTKYGEDNSFYICLGGYDIAKFESDQGLWETCKMSSSSGTSSAWHASLSVDYYFRTRLSKDALNITVTMRKWDPIELEARHYIEKDPTLKFFHRENYRLYASNQQQTIDYNDYFSTSKINIAGYTLRTEYKSSISGNFCYDALVNQFENCPSSCYAYDFHNPSHTGYTEEYSKYDDAEDPVLDYCDNREFWVEYYYDLKEYTITYKANGGSGAPEAQNKFHGYDIELSETIPTREGYIFKGWGTYASDTTANYAPGATYTGNANRSLYAVWETEEPVTYTVSYDANGGIGAPSSQSKIHGEPLVLTTEMPSRNGYAFIGWNPVSTAQTVVYYPGGTYTENMSITLYAVWEKNAVVPATQYIISFDANGGSGAPASQTKMQGVPLTLSNTIPTRMDYVFLGWSENPDATVPTYFAGGQYSKDASALLYAVWELEPPEEYVVQYDANGGSGAPQSQTKTEGVTLTLSSTVPARTDYIFLGWSENSDATSPAYLAGGQYFQDAAVLLYAVWELEPPEEYVVQYDANGGSGAPQSQIKIEGVTLLLSSISPTREGYYFLGWAIREDATSATYAPGGEYTTDQAITLFAVWEQAVVEPDKYIVSYNANGGTGAPESQIKTQDVPLVLSSITPTRSGYQFLGWSTTIGADEAAYFPSGIYTENASITLYAVWACTHPSTSFSEIVNCQYDVVCDMCGAIFETREQHDTDNLGVWQYDTDAEHVRENTCDCGKMTDHEYAMHQGQAVYEEYDDKQHKIYQYCDICYSLYGIVQYEEHTLTSSVVGDNTIYRCIRCGYGFSEAITYTITYDANGGNGAPEDQHKVQNVDLILSSEIPTRHNYTFKGWNTNSASSFVQYEAGGLYKDNASIILYAVWEYSPDIYYVYYDANGGSGAPSAQSKTDGLDLTLSAVIPTRNYHTFLGWSTDSTATTASYMPGDVYAENASITLYAVWEKDNYEFSISNLYISNQTPYQNELITISVRTDSWDEVKAYSDIPVSLYIDGSHLSTQWVDFSAYGVANVTFFVNVGTIAGSRSVEVCINWNSRYEESNPYNNTVSQTIDVKRDMYAFGVQSVTPNGEYKEGTTVISSFMVSNDSELDVMPNTGANAKFTAYYYNGAQMVILNEQSWDNVVIPRGKSNLVYFKWYVPTNLAGATVYCECHINTDGALAEENVSNNRISFSKVIAAASFSQTENPAYSADEPSCYRSVSAPSTNAGSASWRVWEYIDDEFVLTTYGVQVSANVPVITPSEHCESAELIDGKWSIKSGYGITLNYAPLINTLTGCNTPDNNAYTGAQSAYALFPEYLYRSGTGEYRTLVTDNGNLCFVENTGAKDNERVHYIPVWYDDGSYIVSVTVSDIWTPVGMLTVVRNSEIVQIKGALFDDFYQG